MLYICFLCNLVHAHTDGPGEYGLVCCMLQMRYCKLMHGTCGVRGGDLCAGRRTHQCGLWRSTAGRHTPVVSLGV